MASTVQRLGAFAHIEPSRLDNTRIRPDLELQIGARRILVDAIVHPCAPSHQRRAQRSLGTANHAERRKHRRYDNLARTRRGIFLHSLSKHTVLRFIGPCSHASDSGVCGPGTPFTDQACDTHQADDGGVSGGSEGQRARSTGLHPGC